MWRAMPWPQRKPHSLINSGYVQRKGFSEAVAVASPILLYDMVGSQSDALPADGKGGVEGVK